LTYQAAATLYVTQSTAHRLGRNLFTADKWQDRLNNIVDADVECKRFIDITSTQILLEHFDQKIKNLRLEANERLTVLDWLVSGNRSNAEYHHRIQNDVGPKYQQRGSWLLRPEWKISHTPYGGNQKLANCLFKVLSGPERAP
jgi:hypothetical protein